MPASRQTPSWQPARQALRPNARASCGKLNAQTTALARAMCEKLLARNLTAQDDARLLDDLLEKAGAGNGN